MSRPSRSSGSYSFSLVGAVFFVVFSFLFLQQTLAVQGSDFQALVATHRRTLSSISSSSTAPCSSIPSSSSVRSTRFAKAPSSLFSLSSLSSESSTRSVSRRTPSSLSSSSQSLSAAALRRSSSVHSLVPCGSSHSSFRSSTASQVTRPSHRAPVFIPDASPSQRNTTPSLIAAGCGDGLVTGAEACDDQNKTAADGCSATCTVETGFTCTSGQPSQCFSACGDSVVATNEKCDDGNADNGDGCSASCKIELNFTCTGSPSVCSIIPYCGDSIVSGTEQCDDGNSRAGDGCYKCATEVTP